MVAKSIALGMFGMAVTGTAVADGYAVVPGKSLGSISLGMSEEQVRAKLKTPSDFAKTKAGDIVEIWYGKKKLSGTGDDNFLRRNYVAVYYEDDRVVQIEATSKTFRTNRGMGTSTPAKQWVAQFKDHVTWDKVVKNLDPGGIPADKHLLFYGDDVKLGVAWKQGAWGDLWPEPGPNAGLETVIVHRPGKKLLENPQDEKPYAGT